MPTYSLAAEALGGVAAFGLTALAVAVVFVLTDARRRRWVALELDYLLARLDAHSSAIERENLRRRLVDARWEARRG